MVVAEVDDCFPEGETTLTTTHLGKLPYLDAVMYGFFTCLQMWRSRTLTNFLARNESLRLFPPAPNGSLRQVPRNVEGAHLGSMYVQQSSFSTYKRSNYSVCVKLRSTRHRGLLPCIFNASGCSQLLLPQHLLA